MRRISQIIYLFIGMTILNFGLQAQYCPNIDVSNGNFVNWNGFIGNCCPPNINVPGIFNGRHSIINSNGLDPRTCNQLQIIPSGESRVIKLGNELIGGEAERLKYILQVDSSNSLLLYRYAVVLQDPGHDPNDQPRFGIKVFDQNGNVIPCTYYEVVASSGLADFNLCFQQEVIWKDWITVGVDLSSYYGQTVTIEAYTTDCGLGGHYGYAYLNLHCSPLKIFSNFCMGDSIVNFNAPIGFQTYQWSNGSNSTNVAFPINQIPNNLTCTLVSYSGCTLVLEAPFTISNTVADFSYLINCTGEVSFNDLSQGNPNFIQSWLWDFGDGTQSATMNPTHSYATIGNYLVTLISNSGCPDTISQQLVIDEVFEANFINTSCTLNADLLQISIHLIPINGILMGFLLGIYPP